MTSFSSNAAPGTLLVQLNVIVAAAGLGRALPALGVLLLEPVRGMNLRRLLLEIIPFAFGLGRGMIGSTHAFLVVGHDENSSAGDAGSGCERCAGRGKTVYEHQFGLAFGPIGFFSGEFVDL